MILGKSHHCGSVDVLFRCLFVLREGAENRRAIADFCLSVAMFVELVMVAPHDARSGGSQPGGSGRPQVTYPGHNAIEPIATDL